MVRPDGRGNEGMPEEVLLKELWDVATPDERKVLASLIFKLVG